MKFPKYLFIIILAAVLFECHNPGSRHNQMGDAADLFHQLKGTWKMDGKELYELWAYEAGTFRGVVYRISGKDTTITETLQLLMKGDTAYLRAIVTNQNRSEPVDFKMIEITDKSGVFENPGHDFPTTIGYELIANDRLKAWIQGDLEGINKKIEFHYTRQ